jgi:SAM-dependent methyltransferase
VKHLLTIAIPTLSNNQQLHWCLESLFLKTDFPYHVIVVNNAPEDRANLDDMIQVSRLGDALSVMHMPKNVGWMGAVNAALAVCDTEFFCMLNDDVVFVPGQNDFWRRLAGGLLDADVAACGPCSNFVAGCQSLMAVNIPDIVDTTLLIGFCMMLKTEVFRKVGGLNASLPGGDDLDLSIRLRKAGYRLVINRTAYLHHFGQQTGRRLHGAAWDGVEQQEATNNALIRANGMLEWYNVLSPSWSHTTVTLATHEGPSEAAWLEEKLSPFRGTASVGMNLGCGGNKCEWEDLKILGVDLAEKGLRGVGGRKFQGSEADIVGDATVMDFCESESQDFIVAQHLLEHLLDPLAALRLWFDRLKPGGLLLLTVPDQERVQAILLDCSHLHAFSPESLRNLVSAAGFHVLECQTHCWGVVVLSARKKGAGDELQG